MFAQCTNNILLYIIYHLIQLRSHLKNHLPMNQAWYHSITTQNGGVKINEPSSWWWFDSKSKASVIISLEENTHRNICVKFLCPVIEFFAKLHHV